MVNWFGPASWGAPICQHAPRCEAPVGVPCARCRRPFTDADSGVTMPGSDGPAAFHLACHLKSVLDHRQWLAFGLEPEEADGLVGGVFECRRCRLRYEVGRGWMPL